MKLGKHDMTRSPIRGKEARSRLPKWWCFLELPIFRGGPRIPSGFQEGAFSELPLKVSKHIFDRLLFGVSKQGFKELGA